MLVSLHDINAFNDSDGTFNFDKSQIFANCMMGFLVHAGHHSMIEVAEVYNRLCDLVAINLLEKNGPSPDINEEKLPYYRIGAYPTLFNNLYRDKVLSTTPQADKTKYQFKF